MRFNHLVNLLTFIKFMVFNQNHNTKMKLISLILKNTQIYSSQNKLALK